MRNCDINQFQASQPISKEIVERLEKNEKEKKFCGEIKTAAVCVYPSRVAEAVYHLSALNVKLPVASGIVLFNHFIH